MAVLTEKQDIDKKSLNYNILVDTCSIALYFRIQVHNIPPKHHIKNEKIVFRDAAWINLAYWKLQISRKSQYDTVA